MVGVIRDRVVPFRFGFRFCFRNQRNDFLRRLLGSRRILSSIVFRVVFIEVRLKRTGAFLGNFKIYRLEQTAR